MPSCLNCTNLAQAASKVIKEINRLLSSQPGPLVVALDGGSGAGKSTLAAAVERQLAATVIPLDDFFAADIPDHQWDQFTIEERLNYVFDWHRLRDSVLTPLLAGKPVQWYAFDFAAGLRSDGTYGRQEHPTQREPAEVILLDGAYSASPALADLVGLAVLVEVPLEDRHARLATREGQDFLTTWHRRWGPVENYYFTHLRPRRAFDLVVSLAQ